MHFWNLISLHPLLSHLHLFSPTPLSTLPSPPRLLSHPSRTRPPLKSGPRTLSAFRRTALCAASSASAAALAARRRDPSGACVCARVRGRDVSLMQSSRGAHLQSSSPPASARKHVIRSSLIILWHLAISNPSQTLVRLRGRRGQTAGAVLQAIIATNCRTNNSIIQLPNTLNCHSYFTRTPDISFVVEHAKNNIDEPPPIFYCPSFFAFVPLSALSALSALCSLSFFSFAVPGQVHHGALAGHGLQRPAPPVLCQVSRGRVGAGPCAGAGYRGIPCLGLRLRLLGSLENRRNETDLKH